jgi:hypothetical protein
MVNNLGDKDEKINVARYYADEVLADKPANLATNISHTVGNKVNTYAVTTNRGTRVARRESHENLDRAFK